MPCSSTTSFGIQRCWLKKTLDTVALPPKGPVRDAPSRVRRGTPPPARPAWADGRRDAIRRSICAAAAPTPCACRRKCRRGHGDVPVPGLPPSFDRAGGSAGRYPALYRKKKQENGECGDHRGRHDRTPVDIVLAEKLVEAQRQGLEVRLRDGGRKSSAFRYGSSSIFSARN